MDINSSVYGAFKGCWHRGTMAFLKPYTWQGKKVIDYTQSKRLRIVRKNTVGWNVFVFYKNHEHYFAVLALPGDTIELMHSKHRTEKPIHVCRYYV